MKKILFTILACLLFQNLFSQISIGPKLGFGAGSIRSKNLKDNLEVQNQADPDIRTWEVKNRLGLFYGVGAFAQYNINDNFAILAELSYNGLNSKIKINYEENDIDGGGNGDIIKIESEAKIKASFFSLPVLVKYSFSENGPYVLGGFRLNFMGTPKITSEETRTRDQFSGGALIQNTIETRSVSADLNVFKSPRLNFILGLGTATQLNDKDLYLDIRYNFPLSKSEMFTTSVAYDDIAFKNNEVFGAWGKTDVELDAPGFRLNDFKMGFIEVSVSYALFQK